MISFEPLLKTLENRGLSLYDLVKNNIIAYVCYKNIEKGGVVRMSSLKRVAEFLNCDLDEICEWKTREGFGGCEANADRRSKR